MAYADIEAVRAPTEGFCEPEQLLHAAWKRYRIPLAITEAYLACTREEQMRWLSEIWNAAHAARRAGASVAAVTAWSLFGAYDWNSLLTRNEGRYEPGAWDLRSPKPRPTALARMLGTLAARSTISEPAILAEPGWWRRRIRILRSAQNEDAAPRPRTDFDPNKDVGEDTGRIVLISGATGTLGQAFARICHRRGLPFRLLSRAEMDIADAASVCSALLTHRPWAVVNAAGFVRVDAAESERFMCLRENAAGPAVLARACREYGCALLTFSSGSRLQRRKARAVFRERFGRAVERSMDKAKPPPSAAWPHCIQPRSLCGLARFSVRGTAGISLRWLWRNCALANL